MARVLHIGKFFPPFAGGIENFLADLLPAQSQKGDQVAALVHDHQRQWRRSFSRPAAEHWRDHALWRVPCYGRLLYAPISPQFPIWLNSVIHTWQPQLLHLHLPNTSAFAALLLPSARRLPWVIHWHSDVVAGNFDRRLALAYHAYRPLEQALLRHSARIIATSPPYLAHSPALLDWQDKTEIIPLGLDNQRLPQPDEKARHWAERQWLPNRLRVLCVGRLTYYKGHEVLLQAVADAPDVQLCLVGEGEQRKKLTTLHARLQSGERVKLPGKCSDAELAALLHSCDCVCLPSIERTEAFGMVLLEAMSQGRAIVATQIPGSGVGWVVQPEITGLLIPPSDSTALTNALQRLADNPRLRNALGKAAQQRFTEQFDITRIAARLQALYQQVLTEKSH